MDRRTLLGVGAASLIAPVTRTLACAVPPVGSYDQMVEGGDCMLPTWVGDQSAEWQAVHYSFMVAVGARPFPPGSRYIADFSDAWLRAQLRPGELADFGDLVNLMEFFGMGVGAWGARRGSAQGFMVGSVIGFGIGAAMWLGYNGGTIWANATAPMYCPPGQTLYYGPNSGAIYGGGTYHGGIGGGAICVIPGGDPDFPVRQY